MVSYTPINTDRHNRPSPAMALDPAGVCAGRIYLRTKLQSRCSASEMLGCISTTLQPLQTSSCRLQAPLGFVTERKIAVSTQKVCESCEKHRSTGWTKEPPKNHQEVLSLYPSYLLVQWQTWRREAGCVNQQCLGNASLAQPHQIQAQLFQTRKLLKIRISGDICTAELERHAIDL